MRGALEEIFYNARMQPDDLWRKLGKYLLGQRTDMGLKPIEVERRGGPSYKTVQTIDRGVIKSVQSVEQYAAAVGLNLADVLAELLTETKTPISAEAAQVVRKFEQTTVDGRSALLALARALPDAEEPPRIA
jgi:hypothetical protein